MRIPDLSHLQFAVLTVLVRGKCSGRELRSELAKAGAKKTGPAFYQLMARMEDAKWVKGWYEQKIVDGQIIRERWYEALGSGVAAFNDTREFYLNAGTERVRGGGLAGA